MAEKQDGRNDRRFPFIITLSNRLPNPRAHDEVGGSFNANARLQERLKTIPLPAEAVHDFSSYNSNVSISNDEMDKINIPGLTNGALSMNDSRDSTAYKGWKLCSPLETLRYWTRVRSSARMVKSKIKGVASKESCTTMSDSDQTEKGNSQRTSHSLKMLIVERPPQRISE